MWAAVLTRCRADGYSVRVFDLPVCDFTGLEGEPGIEVVQGDITQMATITQAVQGVSAVMHLAAILPPASERNRERTLAINVDGTMNMIRAMEANAREAVLVFSSSVSTYGDTTSETPPVRVEHPQTALDIYAESKIASERLVRQAQLPTVVLRIAGIAVPALQEPPPVWPFTAEQRLEMVHREDVVTALYKALITPGPRENAEHCRRGNVADQWTSVRGGSLRDSRRAARDGGISRSGWSRVGRLV